MKKHVVFMRHDRAGRGSAHQWRWPMKVPRIRNRIISSGFVHHYEDEGEIGDQAFIDIDQIKVDTDMTGVVWLSSRAHRPGRESDLAAMIARILLKGELGSQRHHRQATGVSSECLIDVE